MYPSIINAALRRRCPKEWKKWKEVFKKSLLLPKLCRPCAHVYVLIKSPHASDSPEIGFYLQQVEKSRGLERLFHSNGRRKASVKPTKAEPLIQVHVPEETNAMLLRQTQKRFHFNLSRPAKEREKERKKKYLFFWPTHIRSYRHYMLMLTQSCAL